MRSDTGCPWDKERPPFPQTLLLEETYELIAP